MDPTTSESAATAGSASESSPPAPGTRWKLGKKPIFAVAQHNHPHASFHRWDHLTGTNTPKRHSHLQSPEARTSSATAQATSAAALTLMRAMIQKA